MTALDALLDLLERVAASRSASALVSEEDLKHWPTEAVQDLKAKRLLQRASSATSVVCPGCEQECTMPVEVESSGTGQTVSFVVCDKRDDINRVPISALQLRQWRCDVRALSVFVAASLKLRVERVEKADGGLWELGIVSSKRRRQMVCLRHGEGIELVAGSNAVILAELVRFGNDGYSLDREEVRQLVDSTTTGDSRYTPSVARREQRRQLTQLRYERWRKEYRALKKKQSGKSDVWYSLRISKMEVAEGKSAETIRKHLKQ